MPTVQRRMPFEPVMKIVQVRMGELAREKITMTSLSHYLNVSRKALYEWIELGIPELSADKVAIELGLMAEMIWGDW